MKHTTFALAVIAVLGIGVSVHAAPTPVYFNVGSAQGYIEQANDADGAVSVSTTIASNGARVGLELDKYWLEPSGSPMGPINNFELNNNSLPSPVGLPAGPTRVTQIVLPTAAAAGRSSFDVMITDEKLSNQTIYSWTDFHIEIELISGDGSLTVLNTPVPGTRLPAVQALEENGTYRYDFYGGVWANDSVVASLFDNGPDNALTLRVSLGAQQQIVTLKEWPTRIVPEPATLAMLGIGSLGMTMLNRRRRK